MLSFGLLFHACLFVLSFVWCREVFSRFRRDAGRLRASEDRAERAAIATIWTGTVLILGYWIWSIAGWALDVAGRF